MDPLTINRPIPFGWHRDGTIAQAEIRQRCAICVGETGSGKSVVLQNLNAGLVRCPDVLVWHIDLGGAGMALPWLGPWLDGDMDRPVIDWVAPSPDEALTMTGFALQVIKQRRLVYRRLMRQVDADMIPLSHDLPGIYIVLDEGAEATGVSADPRLASNLTRIVQLGRYVGVRLLMSGLRATSEVVARQAFVQLGLRIGMQVTDESEINYLFGWRFRPDPEDTPYLGCGLWRDGSIGPVRPFRSYDLSRPSSIARIAFGCEPWRPVLDDPSQQVPLRDAYMARWDRAVPVLQGGDDPGVAGSHDPRVMAPARGPATGVIDLGPVDAAIARARAATLPQREVEQRWEAIAEQLEDERAAGATAAGSVDARARMGELLDAAGPAGISGPKLHAALTAEGHEVSERTVYRWLSSDASDDGYGKYVHLRHRSDN